MQITLNSIFETLKSDVKVSIVDDLHKYAPISGKPSALSKKLEGQGFCLIKSINANDNRVIIEIESSTYEEYFVKCTKKTEANVLQLAIDCTVGQDYETTSVGAELQETLRQLIGACSFDTEEEENVAKQFLKLPTSLLATKARYLDPEQVQKIEEEMEEM